MWYNANNHRIDYCMKYDKNNKEIQLNIGNTKFHY